VGVGACGGSGETSSSSSESTTSTSSSTSGGAHLESSGMRACVSMRHRERDCEAEFVPALVALRVRIDQPTGIAARDTSEGRDALVTQARTEFATDSTDAAIDHSCTQVDQMPAEQAGAWTDLMEECLASTECVPFVECDMRFTERRLSGEPPPSADTSSSTAQ